MHIERLDFDNSPYLGVYGKATDRVAVIREGLPERKLDVLRRVLKVPLIETSIMKSRIVGIFVAGNSKALIVPWYVWDEELDVINSSLREHGIDMEVVPFKSRLTAFGNLILANDKGALVSRDFTREEARKIEDILGVPVERGVIADYTAVEAWESLRTGAASCTPRQRRRNSSGSATSSRSIYTSEPPTGAFPSSAHA